MSDVGDKNLNEEATSPDNVGDRVVGCSLRFFDGDLGGVKSIEPVISIRFVGIVACGIMTDVGATC